MKLGTAPIPLGLWIKRAGQRFSDTRVTGCTRRNMSEETDMLLMVVPRDVCENIGRLAFKVEKERIAYKRRILR
jgi:hypothetical protein